MKQKDLLITLRHTMRVPFSRLLLRFRYFVLVARLNKKSVCEFHDGAVNVSVARYMFGPLAAEIMRVRSVMFSSNIRRMFDGNITLRGEERSIGRLDSFLWSSLRDPNESDVNWFYELSYLGFFTTLLNESSHSSKVYELIVSVIGELEKEGAAGLWKRSLIWKPVSCANRLINLSLIFYIGSSLPGVSPNHLDAIARHCKICASVLVELCEYHLHYNHLSFCQVSVFVWNLLGGVGLADLKVNSILTVFEDQLLSDGGQAERSPTYHIHVLSLARLIAAAGVLTGEQQSRVNLVVSRMTRALSVMTHADGDIALFNDAALNDAPVSSVFLSNSQKLAPITVLPVTGYGQLNSGLIGIVLDGGDPGPADNPGHGHSDYLSVEITVAGIRFVVDPGCSSYVAGDLRQTCRSGSHHNGPTIKGRELMEFAGAFRVGRFSRAKISMLSELGAGYGKGLLSVCEPYFQKVSRLVRMVVEVDVGIVVIVDVWDGNMAFADDIAFIVPIEWAREEAESLVFKMGDQEVLLRPLIGDLRLCGSQRYWPYGPGCSKKASSFSIRACESTGYSSSVFLVSSIGVAVIDSLNIDPAALVSTARILGRKLNES